MSTKLRSTNSGSDFLQISIRQVKRYDYAYDELKRLTEAVYSEPSAPDANERARERGFAGDDEELGGYIPNPSPRIAVNKFSESYTYDQNSNMTSLCRNGMLNDRSYGVIDSLAIQYDGNRRKSVHDTVTVRLNYSGATDFVNGVNSTIEYAYDGNGNLLRDRNKGLNFSYDLLGHPLRVWSDDGMNVIEYVYAPDGRKLRTRHSRNRIATVKDFRGALEVVNGDVDRINFQGGFYSYDYVDNHYSRNYYIQDYQGNIRKTERMDDWGDYITENTVSVTDYYPYGNPHKGGSDYKYSGKYLDRSYGLDLYDFEARMYDAIVPTFNSQDQLAEKYYGISPYVYSVGDPVNFVDPTGMNPIYDKDGNYLGDTKEGFTGVVLVCNEVNLDINRFSQMTAEELLNSEFFEVYQEVGLTISGLEKVWNHILERFDGMDITNDFSFSFQQMGNVEHNLGKTKKSKGGGDFAAWKTYLNDGKIYGSGGYDYETSVENIACAIIFHEYYGHVIMKWGDANNTHYKCYEAVKNSDLYLNTTERFKSRTIKGLNKR